MCGGLQNLWEQGSLHRWQASSHQLWGCRRGYRTCGSRVVFIAGKPAPTSFGGVGGYRTCGSRVAFIAGKPAPTSFGGVGGVTEPVGAWLSSSLASQLPPALGVWWVTELVGAGLPSSLASQLPPALGGVGGYRTCGSRVVFIAGKPAPTSFGGVGGVTEPVGAGLPSSLASQLPPALGV